MARGKNTWRHSLTRNFEEEAIEAYLKKELSASDLQASLGISRAYMFRRIARYKAHGASGLVSRKFGNKNRSHKKKLRTRVLDLVRKNYPDFGPQFAAEKLAERHGITIGVETLRTWMIEDGLWETRRKKAPKIFQLREPRPQRGELVQVDGSYHRWFEKRGPECCLLVFIDDATSELMELRFVDHESSFNYMNSLKLYIARHGKPLTLYSDRHSIFRATKASSDGTKTPTQFSTACQKLDIEIICAETPQAKGRVERANRTLQDRLLKELRLRNISTIDDANKYLEVYRREHNALFAREPSDPKDAHFPAGDVDLDQFLTYSVFKDLSVSFNNIRFILDENEISRKAIGQRVDVVVFLDGEIEIHFGESPLPYKIFDKIRRVKGVPEIADSKRLGAALQAARAIEQTEPHHYKRNAHVFAGFRKLFAEPSDRRSFALQNPSAQTRRAHNGRPRGPLHPHPILILSDDNSEG